MDFVRRRVTLAAGGSRAYDSSEWEDALVVVREGVIELEDESGRRWRFPRGAMLWLSDLPVAAIHNPGAETACLCAVSRRPMSPPDSERPT